MNPSLEKTPTYSSKSTTITDFEQSQPNIQQTPFSGTDFNGTPFDITP